jgi:hypothetical protein
VQKGIYVHGHRLSNSAQKKKKKKEKEKERRIGAAAV